MTENVLRPLGSSRSVPLGFQVAAGVGLLVALVALSVAIAVLLFLDLRDDQAELSGHSVPYANAVASAALNAKAIANHERGYLITADEEFVVEIDQGALTAQAAFTQAYAVADGPGQQLAVLEAHSLFERWLRGVRREIALVKAGKRRQATRIALGEGRQLRKEYERTLSRAQALATLAIERDKESLTSASSRSVTILLICLVFVLVAGVGVALWLMRTILRPVQTLLGVMGEGGRSPAART